MSLEFQRNEQDTLKFMDFIQIQKFEKAPEESPGNNGLSTNWKYSPMDPQKLLIKHSQKANQPFIEWITLKEKFSLSWK